MQRMKIIITVLLLVALDQAQAQIETSVPFLLIAPDARAIGMGETGTGLADDGSAVYWNVGGLGLLKGDYVTFANAARLQEFGYEPNYVIEQILNFYYLNYSHYLPDWNSNLAASITYLDEPLFDYSFRDPTVQLPWAFHDVAVTLGYGLQVSDGLGIGANLRYLESDLHPIGIEGGPDKTSDVSLDLGLLFRPQVLYLPIIGDFNNRLGLGITLTNFGPNLYYRERNDTEPLPANLRFGLSIHLVKSNYNNLYVNFDAGKSMVNKGIAGGDTVFDTHGDTIVTPSWRTFDSPPKSFITTWDNEGVLKQIALNFGLEYWYGEPRLIAIRCGYFKESYGLGGRNFFTLGAGVRYEIFGFDLAYIAPFESNGSFVNQLRFSLALNWGGESDF